jgi:hypothetical protein
LDRAPQPQKGGGGLKKSIILALVFAALLGVYFLLKTGDPVVEPGQAFVKGDSALISELTIDYTGNTIHLVKSGETWMIKADRDYPANATNIGRALQKFGQMTRQAMITSRAERLGEFQLDDSTAVKVTFVQNGAPQTIVLGKASPSMQTMYARLDGSNEVWEISGNHTSSFKRPLKDWRDKTITKLNMEDIAQLEFKYPDMTVTASKNDTIWHVSDGKNQLDAPKNLAERVTRLLSSMNAVDFVDSLSATAFDAPEMQLIAKLNSGDSIELRLMKKDDQQYYVRKSGALSDFVIYNSTATALMKKLDDFKPHDEKKS